jgi:hypothetical protein
MILKNKISKQFSPPPSTHGRCPRDEDKDVFILPKVTIYSSQVKVKIHCIFTFNTPFVPNYLSVSKKVNVPN